MPITRWQQFYCDDPGIATVRPSQCVQWAVEQFQQRAAARVLDLGCGAGRDTVVLAKHLPSVVGVDAAEAGLALASQQAVLRERCVPLLQADARRLPFRPASFDGVYCFGLLHEFTGPRAEDDVQRVVDNIHAVLRQQSLLILAVLAGEPEQGLPHVCSFTQAMLLAATRAFLPHPLHHRRLPLPHAHAQRHQPIAHRPARGRTQAHLIHQRRHQPRAGAAQRMAQGNRTAIDVGDG